MLAPAPEGRPVSRRASNYIGSIRSIGDQCPFLGELPETVYRRKSTPFRQAAAVSDRSRPLRIRPDTKGHRHHPSDSGAGPGRRQIKKNCRRGWSAAEIYQQAQRPPGQGRTSRRKVRRGGAPTGQPAAGRSWCRRSRPLAVDQIRHVAAPLAATFIYGT